MKITRGIEQTAAKVCIHGPAGVGKTTLASQFPNPLFLDTENGSRRIDCHRVRCADWMTLKGALVNLSRDAMGYQTIVIDSGDWAEELLCLHLASKDEKQRHPDDLPYGQGGVLIAKHFSAMLADCSMLVERGINVVVIAHSIVKRVSPPDLEEAYDRYELKMRPKVAPKLLEWSDAVLFANFKTRVVEGDDGKLRGRGGKERRLFCERSAAWDAKNRYGLPAEVAMSVEALAPLFAGVTPAPAARAGWLDRVRLATTVEELGQIADEADKAVTAGDLTESQRNKLDGEINKRHEQIDPQEVTA
jgi:GTPase SAR1 family protein